MRRGPFSLLLILSLRSAVGLSSITLHDDFETQNSGAGDGLSHIAVVHYGDQIAVLIFVFESMEKKYLCFPSRKENEVE